MATPPKLELLYFPPKQFSPRFGDNIFTAIIENYERVKVTDTCFGSPYIVYVIAISRGKSTWAVKRRFSEFEKLLQYLKEKYPKTKQPFPALPPKTWCSAVNDDDFLSERENEMKTLLNEMLTTMHMEKLLLDDHLADFLEYSNYFSKVENI